MNVCLEAQAREQSYKDISKYLGKPTHNEGLFFEVWNVRLVHIFNNENKKLNNLI